MKKTIAVMLAAVMLLGVLSACGASDSENLMAQELDDSAETYEGTQIQLSDTEITVNGDAVHIDADAAVYVANDIVYYESGKDFTYGEGEEKDSHTEEEANAHTVVHITKAGQYVLSGSLSKGQIAVDLGDGAEEDPNAVVTLVLNGVNITCDVAPAVIFYNVYECGEKDEETATMDVDLTNAGARVIIANNSENAVKGSHVAKIYKSDTVELTEDGKEVADAKKLHKYDGAFYSKMSMRIQGGNGGNGNGYLQIEADNEGLDSELHLTVDGGVIQIVSGNDGINTNEDNISVTTINGGFLSIVVNGSTGEGDGIDSNGWLVINGGTVIAQACGFSGDAGIDSDKGIQINGGTELATGNMLDRIENGGQTHAVFTFRQSRGSGFLQLKNKKGDTVLSQSIANNYSVLVLSSPHITAGDYTLWDGEEQLKGVASEGNMGFGGGRPDDMPEGMNPPEGMEPPTGERPDRPDSGDFQPPEGAAPPDRPDRNDMQTDGSNTSDTFTIREGANYFQIL